jgi:hypothetical protein
MKYCETAGGNWQGSGIEIHPATFARKAIAGGSVEDREFNEGRA